MEHVPGRVFKDIALAGMTPPERSAIYSAMNDTLVKIHQVDISAAGLDNFGKKGATEGRERQRGGAGSRGET